MIRSAITDTVKAIHPHPNLTLSEPLKLVETSVQRFKIPKFGKSAPVLCTSLQLDFMENCIAQRRETAYVHTKNFCASDVHKAIRPYVPTSRARVIPINGAAEEMETIFKASVQSTASRKEYNQHIGVLIQEEIDLNSMISQDIGFEVPDSQVDTIPFASFLNEK